MLNYLVPKDAQSTVAAGIGQCHNLSLILGRYIPQEAIAKADVPNERFKKWHEKWLRERLAGLNIPPELVAGQHTRWRAKTENAARFNRRLASRMIIGLGGKGPLEIGITLDYVTGLPVIPGSALKGLARTYALYTIAEQVGVPVLAGKNSASYHAQGKGDQKRTTPLEYLDEWLAAPEEEASGARSRADVLQDLRSSVSEADNLGIKPLNPYNEEALEASSEAMLFRLVFGSNAQSGLAVFHEAVVSTASSKLFELDVMTVHFKEYYNSGNDSKGSPSKPPADDDGPNPINFITVAEGTVFEFAVGVRRNAAGSRRIRDEFYRLAGPEIDSLTDDELYGEIRKTAGTWLLKAVGAFGVGGKTAAGYGYFVKA